METRFNYQSSSPCSPAKSPSTPCAACKVLRRRCGAKCLLAPYFPSTELLKFVIAHRVFGSSNIIKLLQELPENQRADAVASIVYEATARIRDPIYGCTGAIFRLQNQVKELQAELARAQAEIINVQTQHANLLAVISDLPNIQNDDSSFFVEDNKAELHVEAPVNGFSLNRV